MNPSPGRILVVDDDRVNRILLCSLLESEGHTATAVENGQQALAILAAQPFDVVLLDLIMPELDGVQVLARMKADSALRHLPVIVISALDERASIVRSIEMGAADHLEKPPDVVLLRARVNASLTARRLLDEQIEYLQQIGHLTAAAAEMEAGRFDPDSLAAVGERPDALGQLARVFSTMARQVRAREQHLEEQNRVKGAFIERMTHELRSPFVGAGFALQLVRRYAEHGMLPELREQVDHLDGALAEARRLIDGMITYASLVSRQSSQHRELIAVPQLVRETTKHLHSLAQVRGVQLSYDLPEALPNLFGDRAALAEAICHLVHNAIKFNRPGGRVVVTCGAADGWLKMMVADNGLGIAPEKLQEIWQAFGQAADDERRGMEGLGLGLALVSQVIAAHGGDIVVTSKLGQGSAFRLRIPLRGEGDAAPDLAAEHPAQCTLSS